MAESIVVAFVTMEATIALTVGTGNTRTYVLWGYNLATYGPHARREAWEVLALIRGIR